MNPARWTSMLHHSFVYAVRSKLPVDASLSEKRFRSDPLPGTTRDRSDPNWIRPLMHTRLETRR